MPERMTDARRAEIVKIAKSAIYTDKWVLAVEDCLAELNARKADLAEAKTEQQRAVDDLYECVSGDNAEIAKLKAKLKAELAARDAELAEARAALLFYVPRYPGVPLSIAEEAHQPAIDAARKAQS